MSQQQEYRPNSQDQIAIWTPQWLLVYINDTEQPDTKPNYSHSVLISTLTSEPSPTQNLRTESDLGVGALIATVPLLSGALREAPPPPLTSARPPAALAAPSAPQRRPLSFRGARQLPPSPPGNLGPRASASPGLGRTRGGGAAAAPAPPGSGEVRERRARPGAGPGRSSAAHSPGPGAQRRGSGGGRALLLGEGPQRGALQHQAAARRRAVPEPASPGGGAGARGRGELQRDQASAEAAGDHRDFPFSYFVRKATSFRRPLVPLGPRDLDSVAGTVEAPKPTPKPCWSPSLQLLREHHFQLGRGGPAPPRPPSPALGGGEAARGRAREPRGSGRRASPRSQRGRLSPPRSAPPPPSSRASSHSLRLRPGLRGAHGGAGEGGGGGQRGAGGARGARLSPEPAPPGRAQRRGGGGGRGGGARGAPRARGKRSPLRREGLGLGRPGGSGAHRLQVAAVGGDARQAGLVGRPGLPPAARARLCRALPARGRRRAGGGGRRGREPGAREQASGAASPGLVGAPGAPPPRSGPAEAAGAAPLTSCVRCVALRRPHKAVSPKESVWTSSLSGFGDGADRLGQI
ncbi:uncharacterized protein [Vulpes vulpes]|uniref:Collagen alpha-1(I) chain-like n=1 Tax=Vulpes vulpes TaxID=9627 RepID=A0ABM5AV30_VULVU